MRQHTPHPFASRLTGRALLAMFALCALLVAVPASPAAAQSAVPGRSIALGETVAGAVTADDIAPSYFFTVDSAALAAGPLLVRVQVAGEGGFVPLVLLVRAADTAILASAESVGGGPAELAHPIADVGAYFVQIQAAGGLVNNGAGAGAFMLTLESAGVLSPTAAPTATPMPAIDLAAGAPLSGVLTADSPALDYAIAPADAARTLVIAAGGTDPQAAAVLRFTVARTDGGLAGSAAGLPLAAFVLAPGTGYLVQARFAAADDASASAGEAVPLFAAYSLVVHAAPGELAETWLAGQFSAPTVAVLPPIEEAPTAIPATAVAIEPAASATPSAPTPSPAPSDVDLVLRWTGTYWLMTNATGTFLDINDLSFDGIGRRADAAIWERAATLNIYAMPPGACVGLRPLAHAADAPPLAGGCTSLAAWWASDGAAFWLGANTADGPGTFTVRYNDQPIETCYTESGGCTVDLPNA